MTSAMEASFPACWRWLLQETVELMLSCRLMDLEVSELLFLTWRMQTVHVVLQ